jgi:hypothetical protein
LQPDDERGFSSWRIEICDGALDLYPDCALNSLTQGPLTRVEQGLVKLAKKGTPSDRPCEFVFGWNRDGSRQRHLNEFVAYMNLDSGIVGLHKFRLKIQHG